MLEGTTSQHTEIWEPGSFLMSNAAIAEKTIPDTFQEWVVKYTSEASPFELSGKNNGGINNDGAIKVERSVARLDFKDGSPTQDRTYPIGIGEDEGTMKVELVRMALVNMSNEFYYLRRVSDDGLEADAVLCGQETDANYVVDTDAASRRPRPLQRRGHRPTEGSFSTSACSTTTAKSTTTRASSGTANAS